MYCVQEPESTRLPADTELYDMTQEFAKLGLFVNLYRFLSQCRRLWVIRLPMVESSHNFPAMLQ